MKCSKVFCDISPVLAALEVLADFGKFAEIEQLNAHPARRCRRVIIFAEVVLDESDFPVFPLVRGGRNIEASFCQ